MAKTKYVLAVLALLVLLVLAIQFNLMATHIRAENFELMPIDDDEATAATRPRRERRHRSRNRQEWIAEGEMETSRRRNTLTTTDHRQRYRPGNFAKGSRSENVLAVDHMGGWGRQDIPGIVEKAKASRAALHQRGQHRHRQHHPNVTKDEMEISFENNAVATERQETTAEVLDEYNGPKMHTCQVGNKTWSMPHFPSFIIGGAQKSGTTSLMHYLSHHPLIVNSTRNETHFFDLGIPHYMRKLEKRTKNGKNFVHHELWCHLRQKYFETWPHEKLLENPHLFSFEKTPSYMHNFEVPQLLKDTCPWIPPKMIFTLRNPVDRAYSQYKMMMQDARGRIENGYDNFRPTVRKKEAISFEHAIGREINLLRKGNVTTAPLLPRELVPWDHIQDQSRWQHDIFNERPRLGQMVRKGIYAPMLQNWLNNYPKDSIMVIDYRDLHSNTSEVYFRILDFVGIPHDNPSHSFEKIRPISHTNARQLDFPPMKESTREYLEAFFAPFNAQLEEVLGPEWKGAWTPEWDTLA